MVYVKNKRGNQRVKEYILPFHEAKYAPMDPASLRTLLDSVADGTLSPEDALNNLRDLPFENLGFAHVDHHRTLRTGHPEVIFCQGKTPEQIIAIAGRLLEHESQVLGTRIAPEAAAALCERYPETQHDELARTVFIPGEHTPGEHGRVLVVSAGTSDLPVAREAEITARAMGSHVESIVDVGVAGIHRLSSLSRHLAHGKGYRRRGGYGRRARQRGRRLSRRSRNCGAHQRWIWREL